MKHSPFQSFISIFIGILLISPLLILVGEVDVWSWPSFGEFLPVIGFTSLQALLSTLVALALGGLGALGLLGFQQKNYYPWLEAVLLAPNIFPQLLLIISSFNVVTLFIPFPYGLTGIVLLHSLYNVGLVSVFLARIINLRLGGMMELAWVEGASRWTFLRYCGLPAIKREVWLLSLTIFVFCFTSFAIPLVVGGIQGTTIEVLIYEKVRFAKYWSEAVVLGFFQVIFLFLFSIFLKKTTPGQVHREYSMDLLQKKIFLLMPLSVVVLLVAGLLTHAGAGLEQMLTQSGTLSLMVGRVWASLKVGMAVGSFCLVLLVAMSMTIPNRRLERFLTGYVAPSAVLTGFAMLMVEGYGPRAEFWKIVYGITLIVIPSLYRLIGDTLFHSLERQIVVARTMGAGWYLTFRRVVFPQTIKNLCLISGLAAFWAVGDFAFSGIVASSDFTLALLIESFLGSYRLEMATVLMWPLIMTGAFCLVFFGGVGRVLGGKS